MTDAYLDGLYDAFTAWSPRDRADLLAITEQEQVDVMRAAIADGELDLPADVVDVDAWCESWAAGWVHQIRACAAADESEKRS